MPDTSSVLKIATPAIGLVALILHARGIVANSRRPRVALALLAFVTISTVMVVGLLWNRAGQVPRRPRPSVTSAVPLPPKSP